jgi:hypothetical protein
VSAAYKKSNPVGIIITIAAIAFIFLPQMCSKYIKNMNKNRNSNISQNNTSNYNTKLDDKRYILNFSDDFKVGLNTEDNLGISIIVAIDCSGSMDDYPANSARENKKYIIASKSLTDIINFLENFYMTKVKKEGYILKLGLIKFSSDTEVLFNLTEMDKTAFENLKRITSDTNNFLPTYKTAIGKTLEKGAEILAQSGTIFKSLIVITDGQNTIGVSPEDSMTAIVNNLNNKSTVDFPVITDNILVSFIGFDIDSDHFVSLKNLGARVTSADDEIQLKEALKNIFIADITKLEGK